MRSSCSVFLECDARPGVAPAYAWYRAVSGAGRKQQLSVERRQEINNSDNNSPRRGGA